MMTTNRFAVRLSRDVMLRDSIVGADYHGDPYRETVYPVRIELPEGYRVAMSNGGTYEVYDPGGRCSGLLLSRTSRALPGSFRLRGRQRYVIRLADDLGYHKTLAVEVVA